MSGARANSSLSHAKWMVAIHPDDYGPEDSSSPIWTRMLIAAGHEVRLVNVFRPDILQQVAGCGGFMWRHGHSPDAQQIARRLLPVLENYLGLVVYPDQKTCWHYDDKIAQSYLFEALNIPTPKTWVWFEFEPLKEWLRSAEYPLVLKLSGGAGSTNVALLRSEGEALVWAGRLFERGVYSFIQAKSAVPPLSSGAIRAAAKLIVRGVAPVDYTGPDWLLHKNYMLLQEFLPNNDYDTRVTVIGNRAFGFRRFNRRDDFRASGSGCIDWDPGGVDPEFIKLAFRTADALQTQSCAIDGLWRGSQPVVGEVSYTYVSHAVQKCPGHWDGDLNWHSGNMWPEEAQIQDYLIRLHHN